MQASDPTTPPRILLVEDDTISQTYFRAVLEALPARVEVAASCACALERAQDAGSVATLLGGKAAGRNKGQIILTVPDDTGREIDLTLPDGPGLELLARLRDRCPQPPPALAHTADNDPARRTAALQAGFRDLLVKPLPPATLLQAVREALAIRVTPPDWDHAAAAAALNHQPANVEALRQLFLAELAQARQQVLDHVRDGNTIALRACLHRLQASCGLVGARRLGDAVDHLRAAPASRAALDEFIRAAQDLLH